MLAGTGLPFLFAAILSGQPPAEPPVVSPVLERFQIAKGGDLILVPVKLGSRKRMFVLDTGASNTVVDRQLLAGDAASVGRVLTAGGPSYVEIFPVPDATVGSLGFKGVDKVLGMNMAPLREASGLPIEGALGMDFLSHFVVRVDFDKGELCFLSTSDSRSGTMIPLVDGDDASDSPHVRGSVGGIERIPFLVDTGHDITSTGDLDTATFDLLKKWNDLRILGPAQTRGASGDRSVQKGESGVLAVGEVRVDRPVWSSGSRPILGLGFLSRYVVTFDFRKGVMYLRPGLDVARPDLQDASGLAILHKNGAPMVDQVYAGSPGDKAGVKPGDVVLRVGDVSAGTGSLFGLRKALCGRGQIPVTVRRGDKELAFTLHVGP
ncbi:MAG TPA: aspartyl protease family protein [Gemmataceae bacterium]|jgi:hypothetical protein